MKKLQEAGRHGNGNKTMKPSTGREAPCLEPTGGDYGTTKSTI
jgi:hypothetical protein